MGLNLTQKIIQEHLAHGNPVGGEEIGLRIDQALLQDATGTMAAMEFEILDSIASRSQRLSSISITICSRSISATQTTIASSRALPPVMASIFRGQATVSAIKSTLSDLLSLD